MRRSFSSIGDRGPDGVLPAVTGSPHRGGPSLLCQLATDAGSDDEDLALLIGAGIVIAGLLLILLVWVIVGWFEHVLRLLVAVADRTRR